MPHNRGARQSKVDAKYAFVVYGNEYSVVHPLMATIDAIITGGVVTAEYLKKEMTRFGIDLASKMAQASPPVNPTKERMDVGKFIFSNWEQIGSKTLPLPNKFVPYVATRKRWPPKTDINSNPRLSLEPDVTNIGHKMNGECYIATEIGGGWLSLDDSAQGLRIWACGAAIWATRKASSHKVDGTLYCQERVDTGNDAYFTGVQRIHLKT